MPTQGRTDELRAQLTEHSTQISEIRTGQAATAVRLEALETTVSAGFASLSTELRANKPHPPNYAAIIVLAIALLGVFGGYALLITGPLEKGIERNTAMLQESISGRERIAAMEAVTRLGDTEARERIAAAEARADVLEKWIEAVDLEGARHSQQN